jgi:hypothetical protein
LLLLGILMAAAGAGATHAQTPPGGQVQVRITRPQPGAHITSAEVLVTLATTGTVALTPAEANEWPAPGLFHVLLDGVDVIQTPRLQFSIQPVAPGPHTLRIELQDWPGGTAAPAEVAFTVASTPLPTGSSWWLAGTVATLAVVLLVSLSLLWLRWVRPVQVNPLYDAAEDAPPAPPADDVHDRS